MPLPVPVGPDWMRSTRVKGWWWDIQARARPAQLPGGRVSSTRVQD
jgi:hypothetical protein